MLLHNKEINDFDEFWKDQKYQDGYSLAGAKIAWYYQQQKIDNMFKLSDKEITTIIDALNYYSSEEEHLKDTHMTSFKIIDKLTKQFSTN